MLCCALLCCMLQGVGGISDIITTTGDMNVDFADIKAVRHALGHRPTDTQQRAHNSSCSRQHQYFGAAAAQATPTAAV